MTLFHLFLIAFIQGVTEFLPISSSGHLVLIPLLTGLSDQGLNIDIAAHTGTLGAVIVYFWRDASRAATGMAALLYPSQRQSPHARLAFCLIAATIPVVIVGAIIKLFGFDEILRNLHVIAVATIFFGIVLFWADKSQPLVKSTADWNSRDAIIFGCWQVIALIPGASRSGVTMTAARICGYHRQDAARLSMLMSIPVITAATFLAIAEFIAASDALPVQEAAIVAALSFVFAYLAVAAMMALLQRFSFTPFVIYRLVLGCGLLAFASF